MALAAKYPGSPRGTKATRRVHWVAGPSRRVARPRHHNLSTTALSHLPTKMHAATPPRARSRLDLDTPSPAAGPSTPRPPPLTPAPPTGREGARAGTGADLWTDILRSADRQKELARKNVVLLSERHRGRSHLLDEIVGRRARQALAVGYELLQTDDRDEGACATRDSVGVGANGTDSVPPVSILYPPSSHPSLLRLVDTSLPPHPLPVRPPEHESGES